LPLAFTNFALLLLGLHCAPPIGERRGRPGPAPSRLRTLAVTNRNLRRLIADHHKRHAAPIAVRGGRHGPAAERLALRLRWPLSRIRSLLASTHKACAVACHESAGAPS